MMCHTCEKNYKHLKEHILSKHFQYTITIRDFGSATPRLWIGNQEEDISEVHQDFWVYSIDTPLFYKLHLHKNKTIEVFRRKNTGEIELLPSAWFEILFK